MSWLHATEVLSSLAAHLKTVYGELDTISVINLVVDGGVPSFSPRMPRDYDFDSADVGGVKIPLGILQRPLVQRALSVHGGRAKYFL